MAVQRNRTAIQARREESSMKSSPYYAALLRALIVGLLSGATTFLATWSTTSDAKTLGIATATAFLAPFVARFGGEGAYDTNRDTKITAALAGMNSSDVGYGALQPHQQARQQERQRQSA